MPFEQLSDLPDSVRHVLPEHAQEIYRAAFNSAWQQYDQPGERRAEQPRAGAGDAVAWSAVEQKYTKDERTGKWIAKR